MDEVLLSLTRDEFLSLVKLTLINGNGQKEAIARQHGEDALESVSNRIQEAIYQVCATEALKVEFHEGVREILSEAFYGGDFEDSPQEL